MIPICSASSPKLAPGIAFAPLGNTDRGQVSLG
jgi:hypothetical protein